MHTAYNTMLFSEMVQGLSPATNNFCQCFWKSLFCSYRMVNFLEESSVEGYLNFNVWVHIVMNLIGPEEGIQIYNNGQQVASHSGYTVVPYVPNTDERIVLGREYTDEVYDPPRAASMRLDNLLIFGRRLNNQQILLLSNRGTWKENW